MKNADVQHQKTNPKYDEKVQHEKFGAGALISQKSEEVRFSDASSSSIIACGGSTNKKAKGDE
ncbi:hypothetical protein QTG56_01590 [Rossellomorea sp. AcN35-11]|nr:hypothetical protein [Rossellomorea aquimaris]WJV29888.1 hypothetical protein QTG56_01590 [Rossellomorea sp. AcN35-11]